MSPSAATNLPLGWVDRVVSRVASPCQRDAPLAPRTTFRVGGPADLVVTPHDAQQVVELLRVLNECDIPWVVLGGGSNVLVADGGIRGCVICLEGGLDRVSLTADGTVADAGAGASFARLTRACLAAGWPRAEGWVGTPGSVGGALIMNAGSRDGELGERVDLVEIATVDGVCRLDVEECGFAYRTSRFPADAVILGATLRCPEASAAAAPELQARAKASLERRQRTQPREHSAGSIFKNPPGDFAGRLIEAAGLKGRRVGGAQVSPLHANFIVNLGGATAKDIVTLAAQVQQEVSARSGVSLEWEVKRMGEHG